MDDLKILTLKKIPKVNNKGRKVVGDCWSRGKSMSIEVMAVNAALQTMRRANAETWKPLLSLCNFAKTGGSVLLAFSVSRKSSKNYNMCMNAKPFTIAHQTRACSIK